MAAITMELITTTMPRMTDQAVLGRDKFITVARRVESHEGIRKLGCETHGYDLNCLCPAEHTDLRLWQWLLLG